MGKTKQDEDDDDDEQRRQSQGTLAPPHHFFQTIANFIIFVLSLFRQVHAPDYDEGDVDGGD